MKQMLLRGYATRWKLTVHRMLCCAFVFYVGQIGVGESEERRSD